MTSPPPHNRSKKGGLPKALERLADGGAEHAQLGQHLLEVLVDEQAARLLELLVKG